jgi:tetratricopeptide (TPR) repeat protein
LLDTLGSVQTSLGHFAEAAPLITEAFEIRRRLLAEDHDDLATSYLNLALLKQAMGDVEEAERFARAALKIRRRKPDPDDLRLATCELVVAWTIGQRFDNRPTPVNRLQEAEEMLIDAVRIRRKQLGSNHRDLGVAMVGLGAIQVAQPESRTKGIFSLQEAFTILEAGDSFGTIIAEYMLSVADLKAGRIDDAIRKRRDLPSRVRRVLGEYHPFHLIALGDLAGLLRANGQLDEAETVIRQAFALCRKSPFRWHPAFANALLELAAVVNSRGNIKEAKELILEALDVSERIKDDSLIEQCRHKMSELNKLDVP